MILFPDIAGERLDAYLARAVEGLTRSAAQKHHGLIARHLQTLH